MKKEVSYYVGDSVTSCKLFKEFKSTIEHSDIYYSVSKTVLPYAIVFRVDPVPSFCNEKNINRFMFIKSKLL